MKTKQSNRGGGKQQGFTLIEILVVVAIIGILASIIVPKLTSKVGQARVQKAHHDIKTLSSTLSLYKLDKFSYPSSNQGLSVLVGDYLDKLPKDPWNREYLYLSPGTHGVKSFDLYSYGADGVAGGSDEDKDINNWD
ncbi:General secretion pathway protein G [Bathymodiolus thermophilus thioautotrophic gill symbiont]|uniref:Type II secretion system core protein G n=1 Tax=Bathymodiolus thermophilus thioautotrophic gill symbiont TaxID=2360 RepID=A0A3G3IL81_9GAMM|nr:type II secretion system major pseudopilin GspG [Bathymodiolus thermophilus thioautotrophic gill symbiont]AYQ56478.1 general secretion pathway protein G [Bathymodiolus thermophilus thioautotrophic gill symbiont]CAB5502651.1 General secretion pathway protein G [Bathymodiolus thermophilus thioautotrophic gill symbiont]SGZ59278.1 General secretion pathway protein G [Bathymodiolus thermophilus thioautotrophic gill symbiont]